MVGRMEEARPKLDLSAVNLADVALALEDHSEDQTWRFDPVDGTVAPFFSSSLEQPGDQSAADELIAIEPLPSAVGYRDMEDFAVRVRDPQARELLEGALSGRGAFRRFKDLLELDFPSYVGRGSPSTTYAESAARSNGSPIATSLPARPLRTVSRSAPTLSWRACPACWTPARPRAGWRTTCAASTASA
jgi:hypothetical protein